MGKYDLIVTGGGPGGYPAAIRAAQLGAKVALVEKEALGGTCLNWGCIPTKTLLASSSLYHRMRNSRKLGINPGRSSFDYKAMIDRKDSVVAKLQSGVEQLLGANGVDIYRGTASFETRNRLRITPAGKDSEAVTVTTDKVIIATGSTSSVPSFLPSSKRIVESRKFLEITKLPSKLIVMGGGVIGCEFACMAAQLGSKVTIVELLDDILMMLDEDIRGVLKKEMQNDLGIEIITGCGLDKVKATRDSVSGVAGDKAIKADMLLVSTGRQPVTTGLEIQNANLATDERGFIEIDEYCQTSTAGIFAIGDVTAGTTQLAHAATAQGITAAENCCRKEKRKAEIQVPACIFTAPEIGTVGLSEADAAAQDIEIITGSYFFAGLGKALAANESTGFCKWIADPQTGQLLGAAVVGEHATELISEAAVAIRMEMTAEELGQTIHCHPTFSESWMEAAESVLGHCIHQPPRRR